jgi:uncharacterized protein (DUF1778 family)
MKTEAQKRATAKYNLKKYDRIYVRVLKGQKAEIEAMAAAEGKSLNQFIIDKIYGK